MAAGAQHAFKVIDKDIREGKLKNLLLLCGKEQYLVDWSIERIVSKYVNPACRELDFTSIEAEMQTVDQIILNCETLTMFSEKRVTVVRDFPPVSGAAKKGFGEEEEKRLCEYIKNVPDSSILIFTAEKPDKRKKLVKEINAKGSLYDFDTLDESALKAFILKRFKAAGKIAKNAVINEIVSGSGYYHKETDYTLYNLENDLRKIIAHSQGEEIIVSDVFSTLAGDAETNVFAMIDAVSKGRKDEAYRLLFNLLGAGENIYMLLSLIASQFETILETKEMSSERKSLAEMQKILGIHEFRVKKALGFTDRYSIPDLRRILTAIYTVDRNIKTGLTEQNLALEMLVAQL